MTKNFSKSEFESKDGAEMPAEVFRNIQELAKNLQTLRDYISLDRGDTPITINSGYRSPSHNKSVGGSKNSQHLLGKAADIVIEGMTPKEVAHKVEGLIIAGRMKQGGIGVYKTFTHYDIRNQKARW